MDMFFPREKKLGGLNVTTKISGFPYEKKKSSTEAESAVPFPVWYFRHT